MNLRIRDYQPADDQDLYYVCLKTGDHGADGERFYVEDPDALGRIYVAPYLKFASELAMVLEDAQGVCGYALGALDSQAFYEQYERQWRPDLCRRFPAPEGEASAWSRLEEVYNCYHHPDYFCPKPYSDYPSHLHIDLLPRGQGQGFGRRMMAELLRRLQVLGSPGVHLAMSDRNDNAHRFYIKLGFEDLIRVDDVIYMGMRFD
jgi:ribosomal protein S18 acetylase RimI-like enzyme